MAVNAQHKARLDALSLREKQSAIVIMAANLIQFATENGYELTFGDAYRDPRVHGTIAQKKSYSAANSLHKQRLAIDFNLFRDGKYLTSTDDYRPLGEYWESMGGTWGGRFNDGNHFSIEYQGRK